MQFFFCSRGIFFMAAKKKMCGRPGLEAIGTVPATGHRLDCQYTDHPYPGAWLLLHQGCWNSDAGPSEWEWLISRQEG